MYIKSKIEELKVVQTKKNKNTQKSLSSGYIFAYARKNIFEVNKCMK